MSYKLEITILAEEEYISAFLYYEEQQLGLGNKLEIEVESIIDKLILNPYLFQRRYKHYREAVLKKFPYYIVYEIIDNTIIIHSLFHTSRNTGRKLRIRTK